MVVYKEKIYCNKKYRDYDIYDINTMYINNSRGESEKGVSVYIK